MESTKCSWTLRSPVRLGHSLHPGKQTPAIWAFKEICSTRIIVIKFYENYFKVPKPKTRKEGQPERNHIKILHHFVYQCFNTIPYYWAQHRLISTRRFPHTNGFVFFFFFAIICEIKQELTENSLKIQKWETFRQWKHDKYATLTQAGWHNDTLRSHDQSREESCDLCWSASSQVTLVTIVTYLESSGCTVSLSISQRPRRRLPRQSKN